MLKPADIDFIVANEGADVTRLLLGKAPQGINLPLCCKCIQAREKMKIKAPLWYSNPSLAYPFAVSVEQGSSQATALFKQKIISGLLNSTLITADLTGGMGIDSFFISRIASKHYYFERNAELCAATEYNFRQLGAGNIEVSNRDITDDDCAALRELEGKGISLIYIDPARRTASGGKAILLQDYEPNVIELQKRLFAVSRHILVKVSPMTDIKLNLRHLPHTTAVYVVAVANECKELLFLLDREAVNNDVDIISISLDTNGLKNEFRFRPGEEEAAEATYATELGKYLYEPGKAILKGGAYKLISQRYGCRKLAPSTHLYTSDEIIEDFPGKIFKVEEVVPFNKKSLKEVASKHPKADLTARNFPMDTNALKKLSGIKDGGNRHIFAVTLCNGAKVLAVTSHFQVSEI
ncbi:MAG: SAM-dependent methyltransferase [Bacteroidales bacterium]|nr:SAM-dependent methyltransferase [Bacteroidales bacterium]